jgi:predicted flap endonuclease-1-like 5' DNA nuclease
MKVYNNWKRPIRVGRDTISQGGVADVPEHLLLQPRLQRLRATKKLIWPWTKEKEEALAKEKAEPKVEHRVLELSTKVKVTDEVMTSAKNDLTVLSNVGTGRAKKLNQAGITTFAEVVNAGVMKVGDLLDIPADMAEQIVADAKAKVG